MSQRVQRILVVYAALVGCGDVPAAKPQPPPRAAATPAPAAVPEPDPPKFDAPEPVPRPPALAPALERRVGHSINALTIDLQHALARRPGNLLVSGVSVALGLAMVHAGSTGATARELTTLLHLDGPASELYPGFAGLAARYTHPNEHVTVAVASRLFADATVAFKPTYLDLLRAAFAAPLEQLDLRGDLPGARDRIHGWVREQTHAKLAELLPANALDAKSRLILASAAYFKGDWLEPFDAAVTAPQRFHGAGGKRQVPMMRSVRRLRLASSKPGKARVLELPYEGDEYSMVIVLPAARTGLAALEKEIDADKLQGWLDAAKETAIELRLPRFAVDSSIDLAPTLQALGAGRLFKRKRANLGGMTGKKLALTDAHHRAHITVEERGKAPAPTTAIVVSVGSAPANPVPFIVDHPFLFYIRDMRTGVLLLYGRVTDPL